MELPCGIGKEWPSCGRGEAVMGGWCSRSDSQDKGKALMTPKGMMEEETLQRQQEF